MQTEAEFPDLQCSGHQHSNGLLAFSVFAEYSIVTWLECLQSTQTYPHQLFSSRQTLLCLIRIRASLKSVGNEDVSFWIQTLCQQGDCMLDIVPARNLGIVRHKSCRWSSTEIGLGIRATTILMHDDGLNQVWVWNKTVTQSPEYGCLRHICSSSRVTFLKSKVFIGVLWSWLNVLRINIGPYGWSFSQGTGRYTARC